MNLIHIKDNIQKNAEAISSVIGIDVTVTDDKLTRIAGTGKYKDLIGQKVNEKGVFAHCLNTAKTYIVKNPKEDPVCKECANTNCSEFAEIVSPIKTCVEVIGAIGLIAFNKKQRELLLSMENNIVVFLEKIAESLVAQAIEKDRSIQVKILSTQMQEVINITQKSVVITDFDGNIEYYNDKANNLFGIKTNKHTTINELLLDIDTIEMSKLGEEIKGKEFSYEDAKISFRGIVDAKICKLDDSYDRVASVVYVIEELRQAIVSATNMINANIATEFDNIKHNSESMTEVIQLAKKASMTDSTILITGESGTGKELFARALHHDSKRKSESFIAINCSAIPENLFESELFGYEEGAYTGALKGGRPGKFELAHKGTLLLDEIGDMPLNLQPKLLRVLQDGKVMRISGKSYIDVDVRIIASTNSNLEEKVKNKEFREDLYYRLNVIPLHLPPLRERKDDLELLANYFINKFSKKLEKNIYAIDKSAIEIIKSYEWNGNVRELENAIEYAVNMSEKEFIDIDCLPVKIRNKKITQCEILAKESEVILQKIDDLEKRELIKAIKLYGLNGNAVKKICEKLGISKATFYRKIKKYNIISTEIRINE